MTGALWKAAQGAYTLQVTFPSSPKKWIAISLFQTLKIKGKEEKTVVKQDRQQHTGSQLKLKLQVKIW